MTVAPLGASQLTMPSADGVGRDEGRQTIPDWPQALEDGEHPSLFGPEPWSGHVTMEYVQLLAQDQQLEVFGPRRATPEQEEAEDLSETDSSETEGHGVIVAVRREVRREEEVPGREPRLVWHHSGANTRIPASAGLPPRPEVSSSTSYASTCAGGVAWQLSCDTESSLAKGSR